MWLICGLGNPGPKYERSRHNIGFMVADELARRAGAQSYREKFGGHLAEGRLANDKVILFKPMQYMNASGGPIQRAAAFFGVEPEKLVVIHDDLDLDLGRIKLKVGGGHGGHNGLRSMVEMLGSADFVRVRCGIGRPQGKREVVGFVLGDFARSEKTEVEIVIREAADAVEDILRKGPQMAMNHYNRKPAADEDETPN